MKMPLFLQFVYVFNHPSMISCHGGCYSSQSNLRGCWVETLVDHISSSPKPPPYLLSIVEEEQSGISPYAVLRAHLIVLCTVHLGHKCTHVIKTRWNITANTDPVNLLKGYLFNNPVCKQVTLHMTSILFCQMVNRMIMQVTSSEQRADGILLQHSMLLQVAISSVPL